MTTTRTRRSGSAVSQDAIDLLTKPACPYCGQPLTDNDRDEEYGFFQAHFACTSEVVNGPWQVVTTQNAVTPPRVNVRSYGSRQRAREVAANTRRENLREWKCGAQLDIVVRPAR
jgi:hypothetical protein